MIREKVDAPSLAALRPLKHTADVARGQDAAFPVYPDLVQRLVDDERDIVRYVCAVLAGWAYSDPTTVSSMMARLGLPKNRCRYIEITNNSMFIRSSAYLVQSECGRVALLAYRGTDPFDLSTWAADIDVHPRMVNTTPAPTPQTPRAPPGALQKVMNLVAHRQEEQAPQVHGGFYRDQRATWFDVLQGLTNVVKGVSVFDQAPGDEGLPEPVNPPGSKRRSSGPIVHAQALYVTGHSLGAAMALLAAYRIATTAKAVHHDYEKEEHQVFEDLRVALKGVHAFAPPMVGNPAFASLWATETTLRNKVFGYVYEHDVVPHLPPTAAGSFQHVGELFESVARDVAGEPEFTWVPEKVDTVTQAGVVGVAEAIAPLAIAQIPVLQATEKVFDRVRGHHSLSFYDHTASNYIDTSQPPGQRFTEFADDF